MVKSSASTYCLNCTFMELKYSFIINTFIKSNGLNCTFMELK